MFITVHERYTMKSFNKVYFVKGIVKGKKRQYVIVAEGPTEAEQWFLDEVQTNGAYVTSVKKCVRKGKRKKH